MYSGKRSLERLREKGYCKHHYNNRRDPKVKIRVTDTNEIAAANKHLEILVRLVYVLFAQDPDTYAVVSPLHLFRIVVQYGYMGEDLMHERLLSPEICAAMRNNAIIVIYNYIFIYILFTDDIFLDGRHTEKDHWYHQV